MRNNIYTALDIGSSKISCAIFETISKSNGIKILGSSIKSSAGIRGGVIENITEAMASISSVIYEAERQTSITAKKIITNVSHPLTSSKIVVTDSNFGGRQILPKDLEGIADKVSSSITRSKYSTIHFAAVNYDVDTIKNVIEPEYMFANNLKSYHSVVSMPKNNLVLLKKCLHDLHLIPINFVVSSYASGLSLTTEEKHNFILMDIGEGSSDVMVFGNTSSFLWAGSVPLGGESITRDIAKCFSISYEEAEKLKILYGNLTQETSEMNTLIDNDTLKTKVNVSMLNKIISARVEEIIEIILNKIPEEHQMKKIILSGGVAKTLGIAEFISKQFNLTTDIIVNSDTASCFDKKTRNDPSFSTTIGLINYHLKETNKKKAFSFKKVFEWMWENF
jgi:cell division protein FtsA